MRNEETIVAQPPVEASRAPWQTPTLRALAASTSEFSVASTPDSEGTS